MEKNYKQGVYCLIGLIIGLFFGFLFWITKPVNNIIPEQKMKECLSNGGEYDVSDFSLYDDGSDYRMTCEIPEKELWQFEY